MPGRRSISVESENIAVASPRRSSRIKVNHQDSPLPTLQELPPVKRSRRSASIQEKSLSDIKDDLKKTQETENEKPKTPARRTRRSVSAQEEQKPVLKELSVVKEPVIEDKEEEENEEQAEMNTPPQDEVNPSGRPKRRVTRSMSKSPVSLQNAKASIAAESEKKIAKSTPIKTPEDNKENDAMNTSNTNSNSSKKNKRASINQLREQILDDYIASFTAEKKRKWESLNTTELEDDSSETKKRRSGSKPVSSCNFSENDESDNEKRNDFLDDEASEGTEDTPSIGSNEIIDEGESIGSTNSEHDSDDTYENDSFVVDDDHVEDEELLSGTEDFLGNTKPQKQRKRIMNIISDSDEEEVKEKDDLEKMSMEAYGGMSPTNMSEKQISTVDSDMESVKNSNEELSKQIEDGTLVPEVEEARKMDEESEDDVMIVEDNKDEEDEDVEEIEKIVNESINKDTEESNKEEEAEKIVVEDAEKSIVEDVEKSVKEDAEKSIVEDAEKSIKENAEKSIKEDAEKSFKVDSEKSFKEHAEKSIVEDTEKSIKEDAGESIKEDVESSIKEDAEKSIKENVEEIKEKDGQNEEDKETKYKKLIEKYFNVTSKNRDRRQTIGETVNKTPTTKSSRKRKTSLNIEINEKPTKTSTENTGNKNKETQIIEINLKQNNESETTKYEVNNSGIYEVSEIQQEPKQIEEKEDESSLMLQDFNDSLNDSLDLLTTTQNKHETPTSLTKKKRKKNQIKLDTSVEYQEEIIEKTNEKKKRKSETKTETPETESDTQISEPEVTKKKKRKNKKSVSSESESFQTSPSTSTSTDSEKENSINKTNKNKYKKMKPSWAEFNFQVDKCKKISPSKSELDYKNYVPPKHRNSYKNLIKPSSSGFSGTSQFIIKDLVSKVSHGIKKQKYTNTRINKNSLTGMLNCPKWKESLFTEDIVKPVKNFRKNNK